MAYLCTYQESIMRILSNTKSCLLCTLALTVSGLKAQQRWTLTQCIDYALEHNIQLKTDSISARSAAEDYAQQRAALWPSLSFSTTQSLNYRPLQNTANNIVTNGIASSSTKKVTENGSYGLNASWTVWDGGANYKNVKAAQMQVEMAQLACTTTANSIQEQITRLYIQALYCKEALGVNQSLHATAVRQWERGKEMYAQGLIALADLTQLEAQQASAYYDCVSMQTQVSDYLRQIRELLQMTDGTVFDIVTPDSLSLIPTPIPSVAEVYQEALATRPEMQSARIGMEQAEVNLAVAKAGYMPTLSLNAGIGDSHYSGSSTSAAHQLKENLNASAGLTISIPILDNRRNRTNVQKAKLGIITSRLQMRDQETQLYSTIEQYWLNATSYTQQHTAARAKLKSAEESYRLLDAQFNNGLKNIVELLNGKDQLLSAHQDALQSRYNALLNIQMLRFYQGKGISI